MGPGTSWANEMNLGWDIAPVQYDRSTFHTAAHRTTSEPAAAPKNKEKKNTFNFVLPCIVVANDNRMPSNQQVSRTSASIVL